MHDPLQQSVSAEQSSSPVTQEQVLLQIPKQHPPAAPPQVAPMAAQREPPSKGGWEPASGAAALTHVPLLQAPAQQSALEAQT